VTHPAFGTAHHDRTASLGKTLGPRGRIPAPIGCSADDRQKIFFMDGKHVIAEGGGTPVTSTWHRPASVLAGGFR
jgi:hypothetical protein